MTDRRQILYIIDLGAAIYIVTGAKGLTNSYMTDEERASLSPDSEEYAYRVLGSKIQVFGWALYVASLWYIKAYVAVFYSRLTYVPRAPNVFLPSTSAN